MKRARTDQGSAAVEMALVLPLLMMLICGIVDFGRLYNAQITLTEAARDGARASVLGANATTETQEAAGGLTPVTVTVTPCPASPTSSSDASVIARYPFVFVTPLSLFSSAFGSGTVSLTGKGSMSCL